MIKNKNKKLHLVELLVNLFNLLKVREQLAHDCTIRQRKQLRILQPIQFQS